MTSASLLLGLSRKPLSAEHSERGGRISGGAHAPARRGLALLTEAALAGAQRFEHPVPPVFTEALPPLPAHPTFGELETTIVDLWSELVSLGADDADGFLAQRRLLVPGQGLLRALARMDSRRTLRPGHLSVIGPRGAYLMALAPESPYSSGGHFLPDQIRAAFAKTAGAGERKLRPSLLGLALGVAQASGLPPKLGQPYQLILAEIIERRDLDTVSTASLLLLLREGRLNATVHVDQIAELLADSSAATPPLLRQQLLLSATSATHQQDNILSAALQIERARAVQTLSDSVAGHLSSSLDAARFEDLALAAHLTCASAAAARLFDLATRSDNQLLRRRAALPTCLAAMDAEDYARSLGNFAKTATNGWADPTLVDFLRVGPHTLNLEDSERLATDALRGLAFGASALATRFVLKLHPDTVGLLHDFERKPHSGQLPEQMLSVLAKATEVNRAYPRAYEPYLAHQTPIA